jgi:FKBP-type peptidyl-prolyl cis-trans isomerase FkpA
VNMLKNALFVACIALCVAISSCGEVVEYDMDTQNQLDIDSIERFISRNGIKATKDDSTGLFYEILRKGDSTVTIGDNDTVMVAYTGKLLNGILVERADSAKLTYSNLTDGWKKGLRKISPDSGIIRLIVPSTMAYTNKQVGQIPPNSNLDYLINFKRLNKYIRPKSTVSTANTNKQPTK